MPFFQIPLKNSELKTTHNTLRDCCVHFFRQPQSRNSCIYIKKGQPKVRLFLIGGPFSRPINRFPFPDSFQILQLMKHMKPVPCSGEPSLDFPSVFAVWAGHKSVAEYFFEHFLKCCFPFCQLFCFVLFFSFLILK